MLPYQQNHLIWRSFGIIIWRSFTWNEELGMTVKCIQMMKPLIELNLQIDDKINNFFLRLRSPRCLNQIKVLIEIYISGLFF
jgi:hypothetical protein